MGSRERAASKGISTRARRVLSLSFIDFSGSVSYEILMTQRHLVAMAGGGFSMEPRNLRLDRYVLKLVKRPKPKVCFLATASGDAASYIRRFHRTFQKLGCRTAHLGLFPP